jgi:hypothetical protein
MKQELVRTKSKICSLKREMSSIQQLHLAQQQVHAQLSAPTSVSPRQDAYQYHLHPTDQPNHYCHQQQQTINDMKNLSLSNNDQSPPPPPPPFNLTNPSSSTQTPPLKKFLPSKEQATRHSTSLIPSSIHVDTALSPSDEQLRLYLTETLQREKDSHV